MRSIITARDADHAVALANDSEFGLGAFGQGGLDLAVEFVPQVEAGHRPDVGLGGGTACPIPGSRLVV